MVFQVDYTGNPCDIKQTLQQACRPPAKQRTQFVKYKEKTQDSEMQEGLSQQVWLGSAAQQSAQHIGKVKACLTVSVVWLFSVLNVGFPYALT